MVNSHKSPKDFKLLYQIPLGKVNICYNWGMIICLDTGGTKTMVGALGPSGKVLRSVTFPTEKSQARYIESVSAAILELQEATKATVSQISMALPAVMNEQMYFGVHGKSLDERHISLTFANLPWKGFNPGEELYKKFGVPVLVANDGDLAALYEARARGFNGRLLALPIGTGIGSGLAICQKLSSVHPEAGHMTFDFNGEPREWEHFASGRAITAEFGPSNHITDDEIWHEVAKRIALGVAVLIPVLSPDLIVVNGGFGSHFLKFQEFLTAEVAARLNKRLFSVPPIETSSSPEEAVMLGCYYHAKQIVSTHG